MKEQAIQYLAMDVHQATVVACIRDERGAITMRATVPTEARAILSLVRGAGSRVHDFDVTKALLPNAIAAFEAVTRDALIWATLKQLAHVRVIFSHRCRARIATARAARQLPRMTFVEPSRDLQLP